ncbi:MAG: hypothetical protein COA37_03345 [Hoeflea sp.]|uniref:dCTP deaminase n=1 Tax=Hoeflea sp. TaxID=1940281 RepID=UPI000C0D14F4|nr:hypothetical protein [Hoeflea sp.]PHR24800.1 MAG: hypothetical protein COA37_03345 [Hoeflea sp.]
MFLTDSGIAKSLRDGELSIEKTNDEGIYVAISVPEDAELVRSKLIQPSSLDLVIGKIYVPRQGGENGDDSTNVISKTGYDLQPGETAVVETRERLQLGKQIGAFGFPPAGVSKNSILMTNPGHVDPGYKGHLTFTLINMGRREFPLKSGERIASLLIYRLQEEVAFDYSERNDPSSTNWSKLLDQLSPDFGAFNSRMEAAAQCAVDKKANDFEKIIVEAKSKLSLAQLFVPLGTAVVAGIVGFLTATGGFARNSELDGLRNRFAIIEAHSESNEIRKQLIYLREKVLQIEGMVRTQQSGGQDEN